MDCNSNCYNWRILHKPIKAPWSIYVQYLAPEEADQWRVPQALRVTDAS